VSVQSAWRRTRTGCTPGPLRGTAVAIEALLAAFFWFRLTPFDAALEVVWLIRALAVPALIISALMVTWDRPGYLWTAGVVYAVWARVGFWVEVAGPVEWRTPIEPSALNSRK